MHIRKFLSFTAKIKTKEGYTKQGNLTNMPGQVTTTPTGEKRLKEIFKKARANHPQSGVRSFAEAVNRYWGIEELYHKTKIWTIEKEEGVIMVKDLYFLAPFTPYTTSQLKAIANDQDPAMQRMENLKNQDKLDIVVVVKTYLWEKQMSPEELAELSYIQKARMKRIIDREIEPTFNDILKICACKQFENPDGSRYGLEDFFTDEELYDVLG